MNNFWSNNRNCLKFDSFCHEILFFPKNSKTVQNNSVLLPTWLINQVAQKKKIRLFWTQTKIFQQAQMEIMQNFDKIISSIMPFESARNSLPLPSPDLTKKVFTMLAKNPHF